MMARPKRTETEKDTEIQEPNVAVPVELQIELAESRQRLAATRYELSVRKGRSWIVYRNRTEKNPDM